MKLCNSLSSDTPSYCYHEQGAHLADNSGTPEKTYIGQLRAARSQGKALHQVAAIPCPAVTVSDADRHPMNSVVVCGRARIYNALCAQRVQEKRMHKRMTITLDEAVYEGLYRTIGKRHMSQFIEDLVRPHVMDTSLDEGYRAMASDQTRESEAQEWCNALAKDMADEAR